MAAKMTQPERPGGTETPGQKGRVNKICKLCFFRGHDAGYVVRLTLVPSECQCKECWHGKVLS